MPRKAGPLSTVAYLHGTSVSFYDAPSNPNVFGEISENGESFDGPPSSALFAGGGFMYIAPDYIFRRPYAATVSVDRLRDRGADVTVTALPGLDQVNSWVQAIPRAVKYFRTLD